VFTFSPAFTGQIQVTGAGGGGTGNAASAATTTCSGASATFTATSNTINRFDCTLVATNVTSSTLASLTSGALYTIVQTQPVGGAITFAAITGLTGDVATTGTLGTAASEVCTTLFVATASTTGRVVSKGCSASGTVVTLTDTQTLTNKTLTAPDINDGNINVDGGTLLVPSSTSLPGTCTVGMSYMDTNATTGQRWYLCESTNTWVAQGGGSAAVPEILLMPPGGGGNLSGPGYTAAWATLGSYATGASGANLAGRLQMDNSSADKYFGTQFIFTENWDFTDTTSLIIYVSAQAGGGGNIKFDSQLFCDPSNPSVPTYNTATQTTQSTAGWVNEQHKLTITLDDTGCVAGSNAGLKITLDVDVASPYSGNVNVYTAKLVNQ